MKLYQIKLKEKISGASSIMNYPLPDKCNRNRFSTSPRFIEFMRKNWFLLLRQVFCSSCISCIVGRVLPHLSHKRCDFTNESCRTCHLQRQVWSDQRAVTTLYFVIWKKLLFVMELPSNKLIKYNSIICHKRFFIPKPFFDKGCDIW